MMNNEKEKYAIDASKLDEILPKYDPLKLNSINLAQNYVSAFNTGMNIYQCVNQLQGYIEWVVKAVNDVVKSWNVQVGESIDQSKAIVRETTTEQFNTEWTNKQPELIEQVNTLTTNQFNEDWGVLENRINTTLENQNTNIQNIQTQQTTLSNRMDTFTSLSEGSTTGDAELKDIRVGANGITYNNAGDAVRGQYSQLKEDKVDKPSVADDGKIPRAKDGNVEWVDVGQPTDEQTNSAVSSWLNEHPEATTTVQDGAITEPKINVDFLPYIKNEYVTPEMFYKTSDGDDWSYAIQACIDYARENKVEIHLKGHTYNCNRKLILKDGVRMIGADAYNTVLKYNGTGLFITQTSPETTGDEVYSVLNYVELKCIIIRGSDIQGSIGMHLVHGSTIRLYEIVVEHFDTNFILGAIDENKYILNSNINVDTRYSNHPMIIRNVEDTIFTNCVFDCKRGIGDYKPSTIYSLQIGDNSKSGGGAEPFDIIFIACVIQNADYGIYHDGSYNVAFTAGHAEYCSKAFINQTYHGDEPLHFFGFKIIEIPNSSSISGAGVINYSEKNVTTRRLFSSLSGETLSLGGEGTYVANSLSFILPSSLIAKPRFFRIIVSGSTSSEITLTAYLINKKDYSNIIQPIDKSVSSEFTFDSGWEPYNYWTNNGDELNVIPVLHGNNNSEITIKNIDVMYYN